MRQSNPTTSGAAATAQRPAPVLHERIASLFDTSAVPEITASRGKRRHRSPAVARVAVATLREARELTAPELHSPERRSDAQRVSLDLDYLIELARGRSWPL